jgi:hypothetical protein
MEDGVDARPVIVLGIPEAADRHPRHAEHLARQDEVPH